MTVTEQKNLNEVHPFDTHPGGGFIKDKKFKHGLN